MVDEITPEATVRHPAARVSDSDLVLAGIAGSVLIAASSWWVGAVPVEYLTHPAGALAWFPIGGAIPRVGFYLGLGAMILTWLTLGRRALAGGVRVSTMRTYTLGCAAPLLAALPLGRDLWAYAAQGNLAHHGLNPYQHSPADLAGRYSDQVSSLWLHSPTPYGPLWVSVSRAAVVVARENPTITALSLRIPAFLGLLLWVVALSPLADRVRAPVGVALWLGAASPLTIVLGVGGGHNDVLMVGLMVAGLAVVVGSPTWSGLAVGAGLLGVAAAVKSPAAVALAFSVPLWLSARGERARPRTVLAACLAALGGGAAAFGAITVASGLGLGWIHQLSVDSPAVSWTSLSTAAALVGKALAGSDHPAAVDAVMRAVRRIGEWFAAGAAVVLWWVAMRRAPLTCLAVALAVISVLVPSVQPWYFCWPLALAGLVISGRPAMILAATVCVAFPVMVRPNGNGWDRTPWAAPILMAALCLCAIMLRDREPARSWRS